MLLYIYIYIYIYVTFIEVSDDITSWKVQCAIYNNYNDICIRALGGLYLFIKYIQTYVPNIHSSSSTSLYAPS